MWFSLTAWANLSSVYDKNVDSTELGLLLFVSLYGIVVGNFGLKAANAAPQRRLFWLRLYCLTLFVLAVFYLSVVVAYSFNSANASGNQATGSTIIIISYMVLIFAICIFQARRAEASVLPTPPRARPNVQPIAVELVEVVPVPAVPPRATAHVVSVG